MKVKTSALTGAALDWAVAKCEGWVVGTNDDDLVSFVLESSSDEMHFWPSTDWAQGGPIIEREKIGIVTSDRDANVWIGSIFEPDWKFNRTGPTPLIAAMRCYVASKLGDEVEVPDEIVS